eukprot:4171749-Pleurochrysis_carterae.AAC.1
MQRATRRANAPRPPVCAFRELMAMSKFALFVSVRQVRRARTARCAPTTPMMGSSVYMCAK